MEGVPIPQKEDGETASTGHFLSKSFVLSELSSLIFKRLLPALKSHGSMKDTP